MAKKLLLTLLVVIATALPGVAEHYKVQGIELPEGSAPPDMAPMRAGASGAVSAYQERLDKIKTWIGEGENRCGMSFHFGTQKITIGYRWNGEEKTAMDALKEIAAKEPRFYMVYDPAIFAFGWDYNQDGKFDVVHRKDSTRHMTFDESHTVKWGSYDDMAWKAADPEDLWHMGWMGGYWRYYTYTPGGNNGYSNVGAGGRILVDGCWDDWAGQGSSTIYDGNEYVEPKPGEDTPREFTANGVNYKVIEPVNLQRAMVVGGDYTGDIVIPERAPNGYNTFMVVSIADNAFKNTAVTSVTLPPTVATVGTSAFEGCGSLNKINLSYVKEIGASAFKGCSSLSELSLSQDIAAVQPGWFEGCNAIRKLNLLCPSPSAMEAAAFAEEVYASAAVTIPIGTSWFYQNTEGWDRFANYRENTDKAPEKGDRIIVDGVKYYVMKEGEYPKISLFGPDYTYLSIEGYVQTLPADVVIPESIEFSGNKYLVRKIDKGAFKGAPIHSVTFPEKVDMEVCEEAFMDCAELSGKLDLADVYLLTGNIKQRTFKNCAKLTEVVVPGVCEEAFSGCTGLKTVRLTGSWYRLAGAFEGCKSIQDVYADGIDGALYNDNAFEEEVYSTATLHIPVGSKEAASTANCLKMFTTVVEDASVSAKGGKTKINGISIKLTLNANTKYPDALGTYSFVDFTASEIPDTLNLPEYIEYPEGRYYLTRLNGRERGMWRNCPAKTVIVPPSVESVEYDAFYQAPLERIVFNDCDSLVIEYNAFKMSELKEVVLPEGLREIGKNAFESTKLTSLSLPSTLRKIDNEAFRDCSQITELTLPETLEEIGSGAFKGLGISTIHIPDSYTKMPAFNSCSNLTSVTGMKNIRKIPISGFRDCFKLSSIDLSKIEEIEDAAFIGCSSLPKDGALTLPALKKVYKSSNGIFNDCGIEVFNAPELDTIAGSLFRKDKTLKEVNAPKLRYVGEYAFNNCSALEKFTFDNVEYIAIQAFASTNFNEELLIPKVKYIGKSAFMKFKGTKVSLPVCETVSGFNVSANLTEVYMPAATEIGELAFTNCKNMDLEILNLPKIKKIGYNAFKGCSVKEAYLPEVEDLDGFEGVTTLTKVVAPKAKILHSFAGCTSLKELDWPAAEEISELYNTSLEFGETVVLPNAKRLNNFIFADFDWDQTTGIRNVIAPAVEFVDRPIFGLKDLDNVVVGPNLKEVINGIALECPNATVWMTGNPVADQYDNPTKGCKQLYVPTGRREEFLNYVYKSHGNVWYPFNHEIWPTPVKELTPSGMTMESMHVVSTDIDAASLSMLPAIRYAEQDTLQVPELFLQEDRKYAAKSYQPRLQYAVKGSENRPRIASTAVGADGSYIANLTNLKDGTTYSYRWTLDGKPLQEEWSEFTTAAWPANMDYADGHFILNEDWYGTDNSSLTYFSNVQDRYYWRAFRHANEGKKLGQTSQYGTIFADKLLIMNKQADGASGILTVVDPNTMKQTGSVSFGTADGRAVIGFTKDKAYASTSDGVYVVDLKEMKAGKKITGTGDNADLYTGQTGEMAIAGNRLFVAAQSKGLYVVDPETDNLVATVEIPEIESVFTTAEGSLYAVINSLQHQFAKVNPATLEVTYEGFESDGRMIPFSWGSWRKLPMTADATEEKVYFVEQDMDYNSLGKSTYSVSQYDFATGEYTRDIIPATALAETFADGTTQQHYIYGAGIGMDAVSGELALFTCPGHTVNAKGKAEGTWKYDDWTIRYYSHGEDGSWTLSHARKLPEYYWFPAMVVNTDRFAPVMQGTLEDVELEKEAPTRSVDSEGVEIDLAGHATDADAHHYDSAIRYELSAADASVCSVERTGATTFRIVPNGLGNTALTALAYSNGVAAAQPLTFNATVKEKVENVPAPVISYADSQDGTVLVTIVCEEPRAEIYYTLDETEPTAASTKYEGSFTLSEEKTVRAVAILSGVRSEVTEQKVTPLRVGIDCIEIDGQLIPSDAELFTLDGVRVALTKNLAPGIYMLRVPGEDARKIVIE